MPGHVLSVLILLALVPDPATAARRLAERGDDAWRKQLPLSGPRAISSSAGQNPGGCGDAFALHAEASTASAIRGVYFKADSAHMVTSGRGVPNPVSVTNTDTPSGLVTTVATQVKGENNNVLGELAIAQTAQGARAVAGSNTGFTLALEERGDRGRVRPASAFNRATYRPGNLRPKDRFGERDVGDLPSNVDRTRSVAFTDTPASSVAMSDKGNGPAALATAEHAVATARAARDDPSKPPVTVGHRAPGDKTTSFFSH